MRPFSSFKQRMIFAALLPGLLAAVLIITGISWVFFHEMEQQRNDSWNSNVQLLTQLASSPLTQANTAALTDLSTTSLNIPALRSIAFYDATMTPLAKAGPQAYVIDNNPWPPVADQSRTVTHENIIRQENGSSLRYFVPIYRNDSIGQKQKAIAGWMDVEFSTTNLNLVLYKTSVVSLLALLIITCFSIVLAAFLFRHSTHALSVMMRELTRIKEGGENLPLSESDTDETNLLIDAINKTISSLQHQLSDMQEHVSHSTQDLRETLETIEIQNIELDLARKEALQASKMKSEFLANTSHEIRTPLNGIIGFTRLMLKNCTDPQQQEYLKTIQQSSESLLNIISDILDLSKIEAGKLVLDYSSFNIHTVTEETLQSLAPSAHEKGLELAHIIEAEVPDYFYGDPFRIRQILTNLIGNAIKFSNTGGIMVRIAVETHRSETDGNASIILKYSVTDSGIGIRRSQLNQDLFNAFSQGESSYHQHRDGAGLGLAISKKLVTQMGGDIGIDSEENVGSTFWFTLKLDIDLQSTQQLQEMHPYRLPAQHILLFDTQSTSRQAISYALIHWGMNVSLTQSYNDILPALSSNAHLSREQWFSTVIISIAPENPGFPIDRLGELCTNISRYCRAVICAPTTFKHYLSKILDDSVLFINKPVTREKLFLALQSANNVIAPLHPSTIVDKVSNKSTPLNEGLFSNAQPVPDRTHRCSVLVVDDNPANLKLLSNLLTDLGHQVQEARSGEEALARCRQDLFDLIFMDIRMPGMDGIETTQRIRSLSNNNQNAPVIAVTAHALAEQKQQLLMSGLDDYLSKPLDEAQLKRTLARWATPNTKKQKSPAHPDMDNSAIEHCIDMALCLKLSNGKPALAADMLTLLLNELKQNHTDISRALGESRFDDALELIHKLHGATCYCGVPQLKEACKKLEEQLQTRLRMPAHDDIQVLNEAVNALLLWQQTCDVNTLFSLDE